MQRSRRARIGHGPRDEVTALQFVADEYLWCQCTGEPLVQVAQRSRNGSN